MVIKAKTNIKDKVLNREYKFLIEEDINSGCINISSSEPLFVQCLKINYFRPNLIILSTFIDGINIVIEYSKNLFTLFILYKNQAPKYEPTPCKGLSYIINLSVYSNTSIKNNSFDDNHIYVEATPYTVEKIDFKDCKYNSIKDFKNNPQDLEVL